MNYNTKLLLITLTFACIYSLATFTSTLNNKQITKYPEITISGAQVSRGEKIKFENDESFKIGESNFKAEKNTEIILTDTRANNVKINLLVGRINGDNTSEIQIRSNTAKFISEFEVIHQSWVEMATITTKESWELNGIKKEPGVYKLHTGSKTIQEETFLQGQE